jgi:predicted anti-sigma-YlaC factor YlaD
MIGHLCDERFMAAAMKQVDDAAAEHLAECSACRVELEAFAAASSVARIQARELQELPVAFWVRQRESIHQRIAARDLVHPWKRWVWVTATVTLIVLASMLLSRNNAPSTQSAAQSDPDDALMVSVRRSIQSDLPQALKPAALLTQEMNRAQIAHRNQ